MTNKPQSVKGMRDHLPRAMILRQHIIDTLATVFERHGFEPLQTPIIEYAETLEGKIGEEEKLIYRFEDHGGRRVALRYDQTVPLARVVAQHQNELIFPWRRYAVGQSYRGERQQRGRYREFWQVDIDIVGSASPIADAEIIAVLSEGLSALGFGGFTTLINHRQIIGGVARVSGLDDQAAGGVYRAIDKLDKIGPDGVREELLKSGIGAEATKRILDLVLLSGPASDVLAELRVQLANDQRALAALDNLAEVLRHLQELGVPTESYTVAPRLARGLSYYTGVVFETVIESPPIGSLLGGGRYDDLIGTFAGQSVPTVGLAFGLERLYDVMEELGMGPTNRTVSEVFVTLFNTELTGESLKLAHELRQAGFRVETALDSTEKLGKQLKYVDRRGIPFAIVLGPDELGRGEVMVQNMRNGDKHSVARTAVVEALRQTS